MHGNRKDEADPNMYGFQCMKVQYYSAILQRLRLIIAMTGYGVKFRQCV